MGFEISWRVGDKAQSLVTHRIRRIAFAGPSIGRTAHKKAASGNHLRRG